jgi:hypothetical protein
MPNRERQYRLRLTEDEHRALQEISRTLRVPISVFIRQAITAYAVVVDPDHAPADRVAVDYGSVRMLREQARDMIGLLKRLGDDQGELIDATLRLSDATDDPDERRCYEDALMEVQEDLARLTRIAQAISGRLHEHMVEDRLLAVWGLRFMRIDHLLPQAAWYVPDDRGVPQSVEDFELARRHNLHEWPAEYSVPSVAKEAEGGDGDAAGDRS